MAKYKVGDKVRIRTYDKRPFYWNMNGDMDHWMGKVVTIRNIMCDSAYQIEEDQDERNGSGWIWHEKDLQPISAFTFDKEDFANGMTVQTRDSRWWLYHEKKFFTKADYIGLSDFGDDLKVNIANPFAKDFDIMKVCASASFIESLVDILTCHGALLWKREEKDEDD